MANKRNKSRPNAKKPANQTATRAKVIHTVEVPSVPQPMEFSASTFNQSSMEFTRPDVLSSITTIRPSCPPPSVLSRNHLGSQMTMDSAAPCMSSIELFPIQGPSSISTRCPSPSSMTEFITDPKPQSSQNVSKNNEPSQRRFSTGVRNRSTSIESLPKPPSHSRVSSIESIELDRYDVPLNSDRIRNGEIHPLKQESDNHFDDEGMYRCPKPRYCESIQESQDESDTSIEMDTKANGHKSNSMYHHGTPKDAAGSPAALLRIGVVPDNTQLVHDWRDLIISSREYGNEGEVGTPAFISSFRIAHNRYNYGLVLFHSHNELTKKKVDFPQEPGKSPINFADTLYLDVAKRMFCLANVAGKVYYPAKIQLLAIEALQGTLHYELLQDDRVNSGMDISLTEDTKTLRRFRDGGNVDQGNKKKTIYINHLLDNPADDSYDEKVATYLRCGLELVKMDIWSKNLCDWLNRDGSIVVLNKNEYIVLCRDHTHIVKKDEVEKAGWQCMNVCDLNLAKNIVIQYYHRLLDLYEEYRHHEYHEVTYKDHHDVAVTHQQRLDNLYLVLDTMTKLCKRAEEIQKQRQWDQEHPRWYSSAVGCVGRMYHRCPYDAYGVNQI